MLGEPDFTLKIIWWVLGVLGAILALGFGVTGILYLLKRKGPLAAAEGVINKSKSEIHKADIEAKIKVAEAAEAEKKVVDKLKEIKEMDDEDKALDELQKIF